MSGLLRLLKALMDDLEEDKKSIQGPKKFELCQDVMCLGTPDEIARLINAGYGNLLRPGVAMVTDGNEKDDVKVVMVQLTTDQDGHCVMNRNGKCLLQDLGLTPHVGKLHLSATESGSAPAIKGAFLDVIEQWADIRNVSAIKFCLKSISRINSASERNHTN